MSAILFSCSRDREADEVRGDAAQGQPTKLRHAATKPREFANNMPSSLRNICLGHVFCLLKEEKLFAKPQRKRNNYFLNGPKFNFLPTQRLRGCVDKS